LWTSEYRLTLTSTDIILQNDLKANEHSSISSASTKDSLIHKPKQEGSNADINNLIDYWYYVIGVNVLPAYYRQKIPAVGWKEWQNQPIPESVLNEWKKQNMFKGIIIIPGRVWRGSNKGKYLIHIDCDKKEAIDAFCTMNGKIIPLEKLAEKFIVEQHKDDLNRAHLMFYSSSPFPHKSPDGITGIEVKGDGKHGLACCTPSVHKNGYKYEIIGTLNPVTLSDVQTHQLIQHIKNICKAKGVRYPDNENTLPDKIKQSLQNLRIDEDISIAEGTRHDKMLLIANSLLSRHKGKKNIEDLKNFYDKINNINCKPPLNESEITRIWNDANNFVNIKSNKNSSVGNRQTSSTEQEESSLIEQAAEYILSNNHFLTIEESKEIWVYQNGVYVTGGDTLIEKLAENLFGYALSNHDFGEIKGHIIRKTYKSIKEIDKDITVINLRNGLYDIDKNALRPHSPYYYSINQKPITYNPKARPKLFGRFLGQVLYHPEIRTAVEAMAYTFYRDCPFEHFFKLHGYGANGKSVFTGLLTKIHGKRNVSNVSLLSLMNERFASSDLEFKDINIDTELSGIPIKDISILKKLTGGRKQPIRIEQKYKIAYDTYLYAKLFFNANTLTDTIDQTNAIYRRQIIISFPNTFEGKNDDPHLLDKLTNEEEVSGIFNVLMIALRTLLKNNGIYLHEKTIEERRAKSERAVNPIKAFIAEAVAEDSTEIDYVIKADLFASYEKYCKKYLLPPKSIEGLGKELRKIGWEDGRETKGDRRTLWRGIRLKDEYIVLDKQRLVTSFT
jgi:P4 family phage/plasmid primase-like protien